MATEILMPQLGMFMFKGTIVRWLVADGGSVRRGDGLVEIQTEKVVTTIESAEDGVVQRVAAEGDTLPTRGVIGYLLAAGETRAGAAGRPAAATAANVAASAAAPPAASRAGRDIAASPVARRLATQHNVELALVVGTGPGGRIVERDVLAAVAERVERDASSLQDAPQHDAKSQGAHGEVSEAVAPAGIRGVVFERMAQSARTVARVTEFAEADATRLVDLRARLNAKAAGTSATAVSYNDLLIQIAAFALRAHPEMNARYVDGSIQRVQEVNLGLAVDTEAGLLVPVVKGADRRGLSDIAREVRELVERARAGRSRPEDLAGGTFTITNLGMYDIDGFTPIVNLPECAILGVGRVAPRPAVRDGQIVIRHMVTLSLAFDHRLVDGAPAARFLQHIRRLIEDPNLMCLD